ncbi:ferritin-like domain-containing protein [Lewinella sp. LCG006]|uniref:ferritin-like domain-containing protein n=1 Tax=Lewinella sp. LCG006 TaxID=3231911 RepID=UPI0034601980
MPKKKLFSIPTVVTPENFAEAMEQAITLELATIPTYLSTYYSIQRLPDQQTLYKTLLERMPGKVKQAQDLTLEIMIYANKTAALIMGVLIEEMLHLALASNVKQAICGLPPDLMGIAASEGFKFPTQLDGHDPEFPINLGPLSLRQLATFLKIESPNAFENPSLLIEERAIDYQTIGQFYEMIEGCINDHFAGAYDLGDRLQLTPNPRMGVYSSNSINTVYYDKEHNPHFVNQDDSGGLVEVVDSNTALKALGIIVEQGEGNHEDGNKLHLDDKGMPIPLPVKDGKVIMDKEDADAPSGKELAHFDKFYEAYSLGYYYQEMLAGYGLDFFSLFVHNQDLDPKQADYDSPNAKPSFKDPKQGDNAVAALKLESELGNAIFTYILLMIETCYRTKSTKTQFQLFMYGVHKAMIWLLSHFGGNISNLLYHKKGKMYSAALTFEFYDFAAKPNMRPKAQIIELADQLSKVWTVEGWLSKGNEKSVAYMALPDVGLDYSVKDIDKDLGIKGNPFPTAHA